VEGQLVDGVDFVLLEFLQKAFVGEIEWVGVPPVVVDDFAQALDDVGIADFDGKFTPGIEAARCEIDGTNDGTGMVGEQHFAVQFEMFDFANLDAHIVQNAQAAHTFGELFLL